MSDNTKKNVLSRVRDAIIAANCKIPVGNKGAMQAMVVYLNKHTYARALIEAGASFIGYGKAAVNHKGGFEIHGHEVYEAEAGAPDICIAVH